MLQAMLDGVVLDAPDCSSTYADISEPPPTLPALVADSPAPDASPFASAASKGDKSAPGALSSRCLNFYAWHREFRVYQLMEAAIPTWYPRSVRCQCQSYAHLMMKSLLGIEGPSAKEYDCVLLPCSPDPEHVSQ